MGWLDGITNSMDMNLSNQEVVEDRGAWCAAVLGSQRVGHDGATKQEQRSPPGTRPWVTADYTSLKPALHREVK